jgi:uncharacterized protein (DUF2062 family)
MNLPLHEKHENTAHHTLVYRKIVLPLLALLRMGTTPEKLAWSLAVGIAAGINPLFGSTTIICFALIFLLRLNIVAGQLANHLMYPVQIALIFPFIRAGEHLFRTGPLPIAIKDVLPMARLAPVATAKLLWLWEWHALVAWAIFCVALTPMLALILTPVLRHTMAYRERQKQKLTTD